jgi:hypothetical protein
MWKKDHMEPPGEVKVGFIEAVLLQLERVNYRVENPGREHI